MKDPRHVIGILGGMGPAATADFYTKLVSVTPGDRDQDHPAVVIWADPSIPDRTLALTEGGIDPTPWLLRGAGHLLAAGATMLAIPCNTAHAFLPAIESRLGMPVVHMIDEVGRFISTSMPAVHTVGVLATTGTLHAGLYQQWLSNRGIKVVIPGADLQSSMVMPAVMAVKAGRTNSITADLLAAGAANLVEQGAQLLIAGCTEIPLGLPAGRTDRPVIDPAMILARALIARTTSAPVPWDVG